MDDLQGVKERLLVYIEEARSTRPETVEDYRRTFAARKVEELEERKDDLRRYERAGLRLLGAPKYPDVEPTLTRAKTPGEKRIWRYFRNVIWTSPYAGRVGRAMHFFLIDAISGGLLGLLEVQSATRFVKLRDDRIGWTQHDQYREGKLQNVIDGGSIGAVRPFGLLCGGKAVTLAALSNEVREEFEGEYGTPVVAFTTTSLYGRSSQYNRVRDLEYLGETEGGGHSHLPGEFYRLGRQYLAAIGDGTILTPQNAGRLNVLQHLASRFGIPWSEISASQKRGVYFATYAEEYLRSKIGDEEIEYVDRPLDEQLAYFMKRWFAMRWPKKAEEVLAFDPEEYRISRLIEEYRLEAANRKPRESSKTPETEAT